MSLTYRRVPILLPLFLSIALALLAGCRENPAAPHPDENTPTTPGPASTIRPSIASFTPTAAAVGDRITILGRGFGSDTAGLVARIGEMVCTITRVADNMLVVTVPSGATRGRISVTRGEITITSVSDLDIYLPARVAVTIGNVVIIRRNGMTYLNTTQPVTFDTVKLDLALEANRCTTVPGSGGSVMITGVDSHGYSLSLKVDTIARTILSLEASRAQSGFDDPPGNARDDSWSRTSRLTLRNLHGTLVGKAFTSMIDASSLDRSMIDYSAGESHHYPGCGPQESTSSLIGLGAQTAGGSVKVEIGFP